LIYLSRVQLSRVHSNRVDLNRVDSDDVILIFSPSADRTSKKPGGSTKIVFIHTSYSLVDVQVCALLACNGRVNYLITVLKLVSYLN
jgi:hypothetical protein